MKIYKFTGISPWLYHRSHGVYEGVPWAIVDKA